MFACRDGPLLTAGYRQSVPQRAPRPVVCSVTQLYDADCDALANRSLQGRSSDGSRLFRPGDWALGTRYYRTLVPDATAVVRLRGHTCIARVDRIETDRLWLDATALRHIDTDVLGPIPQDAVEALLFARYRPRALR